MDNNMNMENNNLKDNHVCDHGKCSCCGGCNQCSASMKHYMGRRFLVLVVAVVLAFFVGVKVGIIKGSFISSYGEKMGGAWMLNK